MGVPLRRAQCQWVSMDIHQSDIDDLKKRVAKKNYKQYLLEVHIEKLRGLVGQKIRFDFPVTALVGTNGGGKSTVLGAAAMAYKSVKPGDYFPKSNVGDVSMQDWKAEYEIVDDANPKLRVINRTAKFTSSKWRRDEFPSRTVIPFPIKRTVPASEQTKYKRFVGIKKKKPRLEMLPAKVASAAGRILAKELGAHQIAKIKSTDKDYLLMGAKGASDYSQFHFGAGEASIIEMVLTIEQSSDYSLILIEEIENGLHPIATEKMVEYLIDVAKRKKVQVIFTTHSDHALRRLPPEAIWACVDGALRPGHLDIESLRAITGHVDKERVVFVEDSFAKDWVEDIIRQYCPTVAAVTEVHSAGGYPFVVEVTSHHNQNPTTRSRALAVIDGDFDGDASALANTVALPGSMPEVEVWQYIYKNIDALVGLVQQRCLVPHLDQDDIVKAMKAVEIDAGDIHLNFRKLGERLGFVSELQVRRGLISIYNQNNPTNVAAVANAIIHL